MNRIIKFIATGFYSGLSPWAPGTSGSLLYCLLFAASVQYSEFSLTTALLIAALLSICGYLVSKTYLIIEKNEDSDPKEVVIDEWAGMAFALVPMATIENFITGIVLAFILFRIFDIAKPWPVSSAEKMPGAAGIMADDIVAGIITALIIFSLKFLELIA